MGACKVDAPVSETSKLELVQAADWSSPFRHKSWHYGLVSAKTMMEDSWIVDGVHEIHI